MTLASTQPLREMSTRRQVCKANNLPPSRAAVTKSGNLNFLEHSGPVQACNGTDLPTLVHSSLCVLSFLFFSCRQNFVEAAGNLSKVELPYNIKVK